MRTLNHLGNTFSLEKKIKPATDLPHSKMGLSDLLQIQRCTLNSCSVILEELSTDMELVENDENDSLNNEDTSVSNTSSTNTHSCNSEILVQKNTNLNMDKERIRNEELKNRLSHEDQTTQQTSNQTFNRGSSGSVQNCDSTKLSQSQQEQTESISNCNKSEIKSGNLVFISNEPNQKQCSQNSLSETGVSTSVCSRYPVTVKIYQNRFERYAIVSRSRRHPTTPSFYLKLKQSHAIQSSSNLSHIIVIIDGLEGKSFHFEASSPDNAKEWVEAFSFSAESRPQRFEFPGQTSPSEISNLNQSKECRDNKSMPKQFQLSSSPYHSPKIPRSPLLPVLSESNDEEEREE